MKTIVAITKSSAKSQQWPQFLAVIAASLSSVGSGLHFAWLTPSIPKLYNGEMPFTVTEEEVSYIAMLQPLGFLVGCPLSALIVDVIGRKKTLILFVLPQIIGWLLIANAQTIMYIYVGKCVAEISEGALMTILPMYIGEICEPRVRGALGTSMSMTTILGFFLISAYGSYVSIPAAAYISLSFPILFLLTFSWMPESPYFYIMRGRIDDARNSLLTLRRRYDVEEELTQLTADVRRQISEPGTLREVFFCKTNFKSLLILIGLRTFQQWSGSSPICLYNQVIFKEAEGALSPQLSSIIYMALQLIFLFFGSCAVDKYGRKPLFIISSIGTSICLFVESFYFLAKNSHMNTASLSWLPVGGMFFYISIYSIGLGIAPNLMMGELLSANVKAKALGIMNLYFAVCLMVTPKAFQYLQGNYGMQSPFFLFGVCCSLGIFFGWKCVPETKHKTLEEIQQILQGNPKNDLRSRKYGFY